MMMMLYVRFHVRLTGYKVECSQEAYSETTEKMDNHHIGQQVLEHGYTRKRTFVGRDQGELRVRSKESKKEEEEKRGSRSENFRRARLGRN